ncbi:MAG: hypothetical protein RBT11_19650 [Desulfobacterales bacterium]|nr:hypothetical protein [Desulfobacterales bacterium]
MRKLDAIDKADMAAKKSGKEFFVVHDCGDYDVASEYDLDTFFIGAEVVYSTLDCW